MSYKIKRDNSDFFDTTSSNSTEMTNFAAAKLNNLNF